MAGRWIVFGGWATDPALLAPLFGDEPLLIDSGEAASFIMQGADIRPNWQVDLTRWLSRMLPEKPFGIAGWSTGAILAYVAALRLRPAAAVLLSATPSFCRRPGFPFGWRSAILRSMREKLAADPLPVLREFHNQCGLDPDSAPDHASAEGLEGGLHFLEQASLLPLEPLPCPTLFLHGRQDTIVPFKAGELFASQTGGSFDGIDGPHAFFIGRERETADTIAQFASRWT